MSEPIPMLLWCPSCGARHVDAGEFATKPHHTHACQSCGMVWRPAIVPTCGVLFLPGFKDGLQRPTLEHYAAATDVLAGALGLVDEARSLVTKLAAADDTALAHCCSPGCSAKPTWWQGRNGVDAYGHWCDEHLPELLTGEVRRRLAMTGEAEAEGVELPEGFRIAYSAGRWMPAGPQGQVGGVWLYEDLAVDEARLLAEQNRRHQQAVENPKSPSARGGPPLCELYGWCTNPEACGSQGCIKGKG